MPERFPPPPIENDEKGHPKVEQKAPKNDAKKRSKMQKTAPVAFFRSQKNKLFHELFFCLFWFKMDTKMASKVEKIMSKMTLEMKSKKQAQNVLKVMPWDLWKTSFRLEGLSKIMKTRGANNCENMSKNEVEITPKSLKNEPWNAIKNDA